MVEQAEQLLSLAFKGDRNYLHGTDIFNQTMAWLASRHSGIKDIDFSFRRLAQHQLRVITGPLPEGVAPVAACSFTASGIRHRVHLMETDQTITGRYPFTEDSIARAMEIDLPARKGVLRGELACSDIEVWVTMTKMLHGRIFPNAPGKWLFVRGCFPEYSKCGKSGERTLTLAASFNDRLTRSEALQNGDKAGEIHFAIALNP